MISPKNLKVMKNNFSETVDSITKASRKYIELLFDGVITASKCNLQTLFVRNISDT